MSERATDRLLREASEIADMAKSLRDHGMHEAALAYAAIAAQHVYLAKMLGAPDAA